MTPAEMLDAARRAHPDLPYGWVSRGNVIVTYDRTLWWGRYRYYEVSVGGQRVALGRRSTVLPHLAAVLA